MIIWVIVKKTLTTKNSSAVVARNTTNKSVRQGIPYSSNSDPTHLPLDFEYDLQWDRLPHPLLCHFRGYPCLLTTFEKPPLSQEELSFLNPPFLRFFAIFFSYFTFFVQAWWKYTYLRTDGVQCNKTNIFSQEGHRARNRKGFCCSRNNII